MQHRSVRELMTREVVTARPSTPVKEVAALFHRNAITAVPVVNDQDRPIGMVSEADLLRKEAVLPDPEDRAKVKELWTAPLKAWFPKGPEDPNIALLRVDVSGAEYWDAPGSAVMRSYGLAKALTTGNTDALGSNAKVTGTAGR